MMESRQFESANFSLQNMLKDVLLIETAFSARGISTQALKGVQATMERAMVMGLEKADYSALYEGVFDTPPRGE
jgi:3-hydroxyisobutyrate dehydrogenase-like beta-hydroxyacid dehydrogenase